MISEDLQGRCLIFPVIVITRKSPRSWAGRRHSQKSIQQLAAINVWKFSVISLPDRHAESGDSDVKLFELDWNLSFSNVSEPQIVFQNAAGCSQVVRERSEVFLLIQI